MNVHIDFETYSECDLQECGAWVYSKHPSTRVLCVAYGSDINEIQLSEFHPIHVKNICQEFIEKGAVIHAWNSFFEWCIWHNTLKLPSHPLHLWRDTMAKAAAASMPLGLEKCGAALKLPKELAKDKRGKQLIQWLSVPHEKNNDPKLLREMGEYCKQDVRAEIAIDRKLLDLSEKEQKVWELDQLINIRGIPLDMPFVQAACKLLNEKNRQLDSEIFDLTRGAVNSGTEVGRIKKFLNVKTLNKQDIDTLSKNNRLSENQSKVLDIRKQQGLTSLAKYKTMALMGCEDDRAHGCFQYHVAGTGRWGGRGFQPHNLVRSSISEPVTAALTTLDLDDLECCSIDVFKSLSKGLRGAIRAAEGKELFVADFSSIETIVTGWLAGEKKVLDTARGDGKFYERAAADIYNKSYTNITDEERQIGKIAELSLGFEGGYRAFLKMASAYGVTSITQERAESIKQKWRESRPNVVSMWKKLDKAAKQAVTNTGVAFPAKGFLGAEIVFKVKGSFLFAKLPSGRLLSYAYPKLEEGDFGPQVTYYGVDPKTKRWAKTHSYGGKWMENCVQAVARDLLVNGMLNVEAAGYQIVLHVHDECVSEREIGEGNLAEYLKLLTAPPKWAKDCPIKAKGFVTKRYRK